MVDEFLRHVLSDVMPKAERDLTRGMVEVSFAGRSSVVPLEQADEVAAKLREMTIEDGLPATGQPQFRRRGLRFPDGSVATSNLDKSLRHAASTWWCLLPTAEDVPDWRERGDTPFDRCLAVLEHLSNGDLSDSSIEESRQQLRAALGRKRGAEKGARRDRRMRARDLACRQPELTNEEIARKCGLSVRTLYRDAEFRRAREAGTARINEGVIEDGTPTPVHDPDDRMSRGRRNPRGHGAQ